MFNGYLTADSEDEGSEAAGCIEDTETLDREEREDDSGRLTGSVLDDFKLSELDKIVVASLLSVCERSELSDSSEIDYPPDDSINFKSSS